MVNIPNECFAENDKIYYAKVQSAGTNLCSMPNETSALFEIPYSYFVKVQYSVDNFFKVTYKNVEGYVEKNKVSLMNGTPVHPYAEATFKVFLTYNLYENTNQNSGKVTEISTTTTVEYYGTKIGEQVTSTNNVWYYSSITNGEQTFYGYVFSGVTDYLSTITTNTETFEIVDEKILDTTTTQFNTLSTGTKIMLIIAISVPSLLILYFLIKPSRIMQVTKTRKQVKKEHKKIRHGDYFEFDESEL